MSDLLAAALLGDLRKLIDSSRHRAAVAVNSELVMLYWQVGTRIRGEILNEERAAYGKEIVATLSRQLTADYGRGFTESNLHRMVQFAAAFPDEKMVAAVRRQLTWTHLRELIAIDDPLKRQFYSEMCRIERWTTRTLKAKVNGMLFERTAIAKRPEVVIARDLDALRESDRLTPDLVFRDPYLLDFLGLGGEHSESELGADPPPSGRTTVER
jgi:hypothetical protein